MRHGVVVLAAGRGERLGGVAKASLVLEGQTLLAHVVAAARGLGEVIVVIAEPFAGEIAMLATRLDVGWVENPTPARGVSASFAIGLATLKVDVAWAWPVDQPLVLPETVAQLAAEADPGRIVLPVFADRGGHPTGFGSKFFPACQDAAGREGGLRRVLTAHEAEVRRIAVDDEGVVADVDTPADWTKMQLDAARRRTP